MVGTKEEWARLKEAEKYGMYLKLDARIRKLEMDKTDEWEIIEKHADAYCIKCRLSKDHIYHDIPEKCGCVFHNMIRELRGLRRHKRRA